MRKILVAGALALAALAPAVACQPQNGYRPPPRLPEPECAYTRAGDLRPVPSGACLR